MWRCVPAGYRAHLADGGECLDRQAQSKSREVGVKKSFTDVTFRSVQLSQAAVTGSNPRWGENSNGNDGSNKYQGEIAPMGHVAGATSTHASALVGSKSANACSVPPQPSRPRAGYVIQCHFLSQLPNYQPNADRPSPVVQTPGAGAPEHRIRRDRRRGRRRMGKQGRRRRPRGIRSGFPRYVSFYFRPYGHFTDLMTSCFLHKGFNDKRTETPNTPGR